VYDELASAVTVLHFGFLAFVVLGGFVAWRWRWVIVPHLAAAAWGGLITVFSIECPLTDVENELRRRAGDGDLPGGFIDTYVEGVLYPERYVDEARALAAAVIVASWLGLVARVQRQRAGRQAVTSSGR